MPPLEINVPELLRAVALPRHKSSSAVIAQMAARVTHWDELFEQAHRHGVLPMLYLRLAEVPDCIPSDALKQAKQSFERNAFHCMTNAEELLKVVSAFSEASIRAMPFKGIVLAASAYGDMMARTAGDLDLLVSYRDLRSATAILKRLGYELRTKTLDDGSPEAENYFEFHFERPSDGMILELRWKLELTQPRYRYDLGLDWVWGDRRAVTLCGAEVPNLDPVRSLLVLCMHGSKHAWSRWMWICDVAKLIEREVDLDWARARAEARRVGLERCLALGVLLAQRGADADVPLDVLRRFETEGSMSRLADSVLRNMPSGKTPGGLIPYHLRILGFRDRTRVLLSPSILRPNERDRAAMKLPRFLEPLYYLIRPVRILLDRSGR